MPWLNKDGLADVIARSKSYAKSLFKIGSIGEPGILAPDGTSILVDENGTISSPNNTYKELTQAEYDALTEEEKNNGTIYFIKDAYDANAISVDNALSKTSTNAVQNKIITECIEDMNASLDIVKEHVKAEGNVHNLTLSVLGISNVENKSSADIRGEITKQNVVDALGYTPSNESNAVEPTQVDDSTIKYNSNNQLYATNSHTHSNKSVLDMLSEKDGKLMYGDSVVSGEIDLDTVVSLPSQTGSLIYTGSAQSPTWSSDYDSNKMTIGGTTSSVNSGSYNASFIPKEGYKWADGTKTEKLVAWIISKASGNLTLSSTNVTLDGGSTTVTATRLGDGTVSAYSNNTSIATVNVSGTSITITAKSNGTTSITVSCGAGTNHNAPSNKTITVKVDMISSTLADNTPEKIKQVAQSGQAANYWSVGDKVPITLNGTVGSLTFSNETYYAFIIGFNHNSSVEGNNTIHFQFGKDSSGKQIAFAGSYTMTYSVDRDYGYANTKIFKETCSEFFDVMPLSWKNVISNSEKYYGLIYMTGSSPNYTVNQITGRSTSKIWILNTVEIMNDTYGGITKESNYTKQYSYYANGNSKIAYKHNNTNVKCGYWLRSMVLGVGKYTDFHVTDSETALGYLNCDSTAGFSPCFVVS